MPERCHVPDLPRHGRLCLRGEEAHHLGRVRRVGEGQTVELFDGAGRGVQAIVRDVRKDCVELEIGPSLPDRRPPLELTLATAVPKGERFDWLVEKATELGVRRLIPLRCERSTVDPRPAKLERLRRVIIEAAKQCGRFQLMELAEPEDWADYAARESAPLRLLADPGGAAFPASRPTTGAAVAIGPEGGFTADEVERGTAAGWTSVRLAATILRIETAALAACAVVLVGAANHNQGADG